MITQEYLKSILHYDPETGVFTWRSTRSNRVRKGDIAGCKKRKRSGKSYIDIRLPDGKLYRAHRLAFLYMEGVFPTAQVDHIDGNGTHNVWSNLRHATGYDNAKNARRRSDNNSGVNGVRISGERWRAEITANHMRIHLGYFDTIEEATQIRRDAEQTYGFHKNHGQDRPL